MASITGVQVIGDYTTAGTDAVKVGRLLALIPDPEVSPAKAGGGFLDEMSPAAAVQLRVELTKLQANVAQI